MLPLRVTAGPVAAGAETKVGQLLLAHEQPIPTISSFPLPRYMLTIRGFFYPSLNSVNEVLMHQLQRYLRASSAALSCFPT
jgi:hypothetical protein